MYMKKQIITKWLERMPFFNYIYSFYLEIKGRQRKISLGTDNPDKTFYLIGYDDNGGGLFWLANKAAMHIAYAIEHNYIPVIDYKNHLTQYTPKEELGKVNIWEKFFKQPSYYRVEDICKSKNIIINKKSPAPQKRYLMGQESFYGNNEKIKYYKNIYKKYIIPTEEIQSYLEEWKDKLFTNKGKILGILCRGTDYVVRKPKNHPIQPTAEMVITEAKKVMKKYDCNFIFIATEDEDILTKFKNAFKDKLLFLPQKRYHKDDISSGEFLAQAKEHDTSRNPTEDAKMYLAAIYLLTKCNCFIGGRTGGTKAVLLWEDSYEYKHIYNLGLYK